MRTQSPATQPLSTSLVVAYLPVGSLANYQGNARTHSKKQIRKIADSIQAFGFTNPILIDGAKTIIAGHGRVEAARLLNLERVPTICLESLTHAQVRAYVIADNRLAEDAGWDPEILRIELQHLVFENEMDITLTGFETPEIDLILGATQEEADPADEISDDVLQLTTKPGDLWSLGAHRICCGDARAESCFDFLMGDLRAAVVFADPPYNVVIDGHASGNGKARHSEFAMASGEMDEAEFTRFLKESLAQLAAWSVNGSVHFLCMNWRHMLSGHLDLAVASNRLLQIAQTR